MKKQMITLAVCLALTATSALASSTKISPKTPAKELIPVATQTKASEATQCPEETAKQKFEEKLAKDREELYCKLGLSTEQKTKAEAFHQKTREGAEPLFAKLHTEKAKLHELKAQKACVVKIDEQKLKVKEAKHALKAHMKASGKEFEAMLDKCQLAKFKALREEKKEQWKKGGCHHHHHHHDVCGNEEDSFHGPFGPHQEEPAPKWPCESK